MDFKIIEGRYSINEAKQLNPLALAFVGDAAYEIFIRAHILDKGREKSAHKLHLEAVSYVKAHSQSEAMKKLESHLNEEELSIFKRGRNAKSCSVPKNADVQEYRIATGFEALIGFLYITEQMERLNELLNLILNF